MKTGAIIQARLSSSRLPAKVLRELPFGSGITVLEQVVRRVRKAKTLNTVVIATTESPEDARIAEVADGLQAPWFRGSKEDVLSRYYFAAKENGLDVIVRITSDCPCIDPAVIDRVVQTHIRNGNDFTTNALERTYPTGIDVEVFNFTGLERAHRKAVQVFEREHVTPYFYMNPDAGMKVENLPAAGDAYGPDIRITLDTPEDYGLLCAVFDQFQGRDFGAEDIGRLFRSKPWLSWVNGKIVQKKVYADMDEEIADAVRALKFQGMENAAALLEKNRT